MTTRTLEDERGCKFGESDKPFEEYKNSRKEIKQETMRGHEMTLGSWIQVNPMALYIYLSSIFHL